MVRDTEAEAGQLYTDVCRFVEEKPHPYKCDTVNTYSKGDGGTCGSDLNTWDNACFDETQGVVWQCFPNSTNISTPCLWTMSTQGFYDGWCLFPGNPGYKDAAENPTPHPHPETKTTSTTLTTTATTIPGAGPAPSPAPSPSNGPGGWVWVLVILALGALGVGGFLFMRSRGARTPTVTTRSALEGHGSEMGR